MLIKICGLTRQADITRADSLNCNYCGFIFHEASARFIPPESAAQLSTGSMKRVGVFVNQNARQINEIMEIARMDFAQFHGKQDIRCAREVGAERVIKVLWPNRYAVTREFIKDAEQFADSCAMYLLEAGLYGGGSGKTLDWNKIRNLTLPHLWLLAGGLSADNIPDALAKCQPSGIDINSGIEVEAGVKDHMLMQAAVTAAREHRI